MRTLRSMGQGLLISLALAVSACGSKHTVQITDPAPPPAPPPPPTVMVEPPKPVVLSVVGTSDVHGHLERTTVFSGYVERLRQVRKADGAVVLVDAGDMFQGTIAANKTEGAAMIRAFNALGYNAVAIGNHEFDYGPVGPKAVPSQPSDDRRGALLAAVKLAKFPVLGANIFDKASNQPVNWPGVGRHAMGEFAGIKVGFVGVAGHDNLAATIRGNVDDLTLAPVAETILSEAKQLRDKGAQVVVVMAHEGGDCKSFDNPDDVSSCGQSDVVDLANRLDPSLVNVLVGGHTHRAVAHRVNGIPIIQSYAYGKAFGRVDLQVDPLTGKAVVTRIFQPQSICADPEDRTPTCKAGEYEGQPIEPSKAMVDAIAQDLNSARELAQQDLGATLAQPVPHGRSPMNSRAALQVAHWMLQIRPKAQMAIFNTAGVRADLDAGPVTYGDMFELFPFDNRFAIGKVKVANVRKLLHDSYVRGSSFSVAGVQVKVTCKGSDFDVTILRNKRALKDTDTLTVVASDYLVTTPKFAQAGLEEKLFTIENDPVIREAIVDLVKNKGKLDLVQGNTLEIPGSWPVQCPVMLPKDGK